MNLQSIGFKFLAKITKGSCVFCFSSYISFNPTSQMLDKSLLICFKIKWNQGKAYSTSLKPTKQKYACDEARTFSIKELQSDQSYRLSNDKILFIRCQEVPKVNTARTYSREGDLFD